MLFLQRRGVYFVANRLQMYVETAFWQINMGVLRVKICNFVPDFFSHHRSNMLFNSIEFAVFLIVVFLLYWLFKKKNVNTMKLILLVIALSVVLSFLGIM